MEQEVNAIKIRNLRPWDRLGWAFTSFSEDARRNWLDRRLRVDNDYGWVFILGVNNSGTTVFARLLQQHPEVRGLPKEGQLLSDAFPRPRFNGVGRLWSLRPDLFHWTEEHDPSPAARARYDWLPHFPRGRGLLLEKSPPNTLRSRWLQRYFSPARFLGIVRSPYATCEGIRRRIGCEIADAARHWTASMEFMLSDMEHLERCLWFRYEDLTAEPERYLDQMERFLGLETPLDRTGIAKVNAHSIDGQTTGLQNMNAKSLARLEPEDFRTIHRIAGPMMERLGYERLDSPGVPEILRPVESVRQEAHP